VSSTPAHCREPAVERRAIATASTTTAETAFSFVLDSLKLVTPRTASVSVAVIGAGLAGLAAGWWLVHHGFRVTVFEGRDRTGGRVHTKQRRHFLLEQGGELIGLNHANWLRFAKEFRLGLSLITDEGAYTQLNLAMPFMLEGKDVDENQQQGIFDEMQQIFIALNSDALSIDPNVPWTAPRAEEWDSITVAKWIEALPCMDLTKAALRFQFDNNNGVSCDRQSYLGMLVPVSAGCQGMDDPTQQPSRYWDESEMYRCASGNQSLADALEADIRRAGGKIVTGRRVTAIDVQSKSVRLGFEKGKAHKANWVIFAVPPTCWNSISHNVSLDAYVMQMGTAVKSLVSVKGRFWLAQGMAPSASSDSVGMIWEGTDNQNIPVGSPAELSLFAGGSAAQQVLEIYKRTSSTREAIETLYPDLKRNVLGERFVNWPKIRFTHAGYSCPGPGQVTTVARKLIEGSGRLVFAGEHTSTAYFGYMEGALESGLRAAQYVAQGEEIPEAQKLWTQKFETS
jgi:monoamine oxidase